DSNVYPSYTGRALECSYEGVVCCSNNVPVLEMERFDSPEVIHCPDGGIVLNFGQNIAGYMEANLTGPKGHCCSMVFGETLDEAGNFSYTNISWEGEYTKSHFQTNDFICDGTRQRYKPRFTVMGFQYVLLRDWPEEVLAENFSAIAVYSGMVTTFKFDSSDAGINQIVKNTFWSVKGNFLDVPTDCPTRERAGWTGDAQLFFNTGNFMMDQRSFFRKWMRDIADCQKSNGMVYNINPTNPHSPAILEWLSVEGSAGWGDAVILIPYYFWKRYGDDVLICEFWDCMERCFGFYRQRMGKRNMLSLFKPKHSKYDKYICASGRDFGEWTEPDDCAPPKAAMMIPMAEEATAYLSYSARLMAEMAEYLGKHTDAQQYGSVADKTQEAYNHYYVQDGNIESKRMCKYVRPCGLNLVDGQARSKLLGKIKKLNRERDFKIGTGFLSTPFVMRLLTEAGAGEDAFKMLTNPQFGWMQQVNQGATTIWENWTPDASLNHYSKGACCQWLFDCVCGIQLDGSLNHFVIAPNPVNQLDGISLEYDSVYGRVKSGWKKTPNGYEYEIEVPPNCEAEIRIPGNDRLVVGVGKYTFNSWATQHKSH
ncbi:family 78 glycoside hydrolase catalytic domain, partial [Ruminococcaceae bacterium OttesenSCG-928-D13]|nr:family 78 glycoside hydrolase catalytic domain [Ruminococcaceae bacterium OttesenSCG-928-D13]